MRLVVLHAFPALITLEIAGNVLLAGWALLADLRRSRLGAAFWTLLLVVVALAAVQLAAGVILAVGGGRPRAPLHFLYGPLVLVGAVLQFGLRPGGALRRAMLRDPAGGREARALALLCLTQAALLARAYTTGAFGR
ncbi:MAG: hypothetical protein QN141_13060 [Armatimonadota bacterium]|nr:hypothetical protein [Armatimonadota bacterium]MDR7452178.1 hypothetical protein [Armatimonadota bacterium]MDR7468055.1 hypothetical protein [Armatimonadota bacterium]MDR7494904.1 hypothetical protein [Armatimonadota bacterium]MDR7500301.1 hypothetical protein [Armatimonadota bacterium]